MRWLRKAPESIEPEAVYLSRETPVAANAVAQRSYNSVALLADNPTLGHPDRIPDTPYIISYRVRPGLDQIEIFRVFHVSRKPP